MTDITIELKLVAGNVRQETIVRLDAFEKVLLKLYRRPEDGPKAENRLNYRPSPLNVMSGRRHETIMISARRGDGKTTFLTDVLKVVEQIQAGDRASRELLPDIQDIASLYSLGIVDPTLIETKQNIVVMIIEKIKAAVDRAKRTTKSAADTEYQSFKAKLLELASGLTLLDGIGDDNLHGREWIDPDYVLSKGLDRAGAAAAFERSLYDYISEACRFLDVDAFVLAIDDVDTFFEQGWPVLEAIRKYLATPRLKVLLAGDIKLYNLLVRRQQWKQMTPDFVKAERSIDDPLSYKDQMAHAIDLLQDQYLVKIMPPENRIDLLPLGVYADREPISFTMGGSKAIRERIASRRYARELLALTAQEDRAAIRSIILRLPMRSSLQLYSSAWPSISVQSPQRAAPNLQTARDTLRHVASTSLMKADLDDNELRDPHPDRIFGTLADWMTRKELWRSMAHFYPEGVDESEHLIIMAVAATLVDLFQREPRSMIDYWLKLCVVREKLYRAEFSDSAELEKLLIHLNIRSSSPSLQVVRQLGAYEAGGGQQVARRIRISSTAVPAGPRVREANAAFVELYGSLDVNGLRQASGTDDRRATSLALHALPAPLRGFHAPLLSAGWDYSYSGSGEAGFVPVFGNTLTSLRNGLLGHAASIAMIPASRIISGQQSGNGSYSILSLLGFISGALQVKRSAPSDKFLARQILQLLADAGTLANYFTPGGANTGSVDDSEEDNDETSGTPVDNGELDFSVFPESDNVIRSLVAWLNKAEDLGTLAPITLARVWRRFSDAFDSIRDELRHVKTRYLGVVMHRSIVAFLHALAVESFRGAGETLPPKAADNPIRSSEPFAAILQKLENDVDETDSDLSFFLWMFACPLWGFFLARREADIVGDSRRDATSEVFDRYMLASHQMTEVEVDYKVVFRNPADGMTATYDGLFFLLNSVYVQGQKPSRGTEPAPQVRRRSRSLSSSASKQQ